MLRSGGGNVWIASRCARIAANPRPRIPDAVRARRRLVRRKFQTPGKRAGRRSECEASDDRDCETRRDCGSGRPGHDGARVAVECDRGADCWPRDGMGMDPDSCWHLMPGWLITGRGNALRRLMITSTLRPVSRRMYPNRLVKRPTEPVALPPASRDPELT